MFRRTAFTLVELLVVIGIIALLISILMPSLSRARASAERIQCASNQRQLALAMSLYTNQYHGTYPPGWLWYTTPALAPSSPPITWAGMLWQQRLLGTPMLLTCPSFRNADSLVDFSTVPTDAAADFWMFTRPHYGYNAWNLGSTVRQDGLAGYGKQPKVTNVRNPAETILFTDVFATDLGTPSGIYVAYDWDASAAGYFLDAKRHNKTINVTWADGHVTAELCDNPDDVYKTLTSVLVQPDNNKWDRQ